MRHTTNTAKILAGITGQLRLLKKDTQGGILLITGIVLMSIVLALFALSIDHGRNTMDQSDLEAKLKNLSVHLAEDWASFRQKEATAAVLAEEGLTWDRTPEEIEIMKKTSILWELPPPFGPLTEEHAKELVAARLLGLIQSYPGLENTSKVEVAEDCNSQGRLLLRYAAKIPQSETFVSSENKVKSACLNEINPLDPVPEEGCTLVTHTVALGLSCEGTNADVNPPPPPEDGSGAGQCVKPYNGQEFPQHVNKRLAGAVSQLAEGGKVITVAKSLDLKSKNEMLSADAIINTAIKVANLIGMPKEDAAASVVMGNLPVAGGDVECVNDADLGWSGSCYDTRIGIDGRDVDGERLANQHRKNSFVSTFFAQWVRRCPADPVWTYESKWQGRCWEESMTLTCNDTGWGVSSDCCPAFVEDKDHAGAPKVTAWVDVVLDGTDNGAISSKDICGENDDLWVAGSCDAANQLTERTCVRKNSNPIHQGQWLAACPFTAMSDPAAVYLPPEGFLKFSGHYSRRLDDGIPTDGLALFNLEGTVTPFTGGVSAKSDDNQTDELANLKKYNTDRSWVWACETSFSPDGKLGRPYGGLVKDILKYGTRYERPLVTVDGSDIPYADAPGCTVPEPPAETVGEYLVTYNLPGCSDPTQKGCDISEGFYRMEVDVAALQPSRGPAMVDMIPDGGKNTTWKYLGQGNADDPSGVNGWSYQEVATIDPAIYLGTEDDPLECPVQSGSRGSMVYATTFTTGANDKHAKYVLNVPDVDGIVLPELPEERLNISSVTMERRRDSGEPVVCLFDKGEDKLPGNKKETFVEGPAETAVDSKDEYPWFSTPPQANEHPFWNTGGTGVLALSGETTGNLALGVEEVSEFFTHKNFDGSTDASLDDYKTAGATLNLAQIQALDAVRWKNGDYPPPNISMSVGGVQAALAQLGISYEHLDIHGGHEGNQCSILKAGVNSLMQSPEGAAAKREDRVLFYVGSCPNSDWANSQYNGQDVHWHAGGNLIGKLAGKQLQTMNSPARGSDLYQQTTQCFDEVDDDIGTLFILTSGAGCVDFAKTASKTGNPDLCPLPYCVIGVDGQGDCVDRIFSCMRKRATGAN